MPNKKNYNIKLSPNRIFNLISKSKSYFDLSLSTSKTYLLEIDDFGTILLRRLSYYDPFFLYEMDTSTLYDLEHYEIEK